MNRILLSFLMGTALAAAVQTAEAGTVSAFAKASTQVTEQRESLEPLNPFEHPDGVEVDAITEDTGSGAFSSVTVKVLPELRSHRISAFGGVAANTPDELSDSFGTVGEERRFLAETAGLVTLRYQIDATHDITSDLAPLRNYYGYGLSLQLGGVGGPSTTRYDTLFDTDPQLDTPSLTRSLLFELTHEVGAGEEFFASMRLNGVLGNEAPLGAFFEGMLVVDGSWSVRSTGRFTPVTGETEMPAPVPLPASLPLLLAGALGLGVLGRRRTARA
ncbi:VPLPA-CTERM sorting domain-containing protein [Roseobacter sp. A03A-229]